MNFLAGRDSIAYLQYAIQPDYWKDTSVVFDDVFYDLCLETGKEYSSYSQKFLGFDETVTINNFLDALNTAYNWKEEGADKSIIQNVKKVVSQAITDISNLYNNHFKYGSGNYGKYDCHYLQYSLNLMYSALWDYAWEARILCALSCCIGFFGSVAVHCFLWVMYYWRRDEYNPRNNENNNRPKIRKAPENNYNNYEDNDNNYNSNNEDNYDNNYYQKNNYSPPKTEVIRVKNPPPVDMQQDSYVELANDKKNDSSMGDSD